jgi:serine/threonine protein kinase
MTENRLPLLILERAHCDLEKFMMNKSSYSTLSYSDKCSIAHEIGTGLEAIHTDGLCHGDLKPANILVFDGGLSRTRPGRRHWYAKICDFGSARPAANASVRGDYLGTKGWLPPEKHDESKAKNVSFQLCDIFAYGLVTWSWFLGNPTSPIEEFEPASIGKDFGRQEFYKKARETIRREYQPAATRIAQDREHEAEVFRQNQLSFSQGRGQYQWVRTGFVSAIARFLERWSMGQQVRSMNRAGRSLEPDFGSDTNRILAALALALDEQPNRRNVVKPHIFFEASVEQVFAVQKPIPFSRNQEKSPSDTEVAVESSSMAQARQIWGTAKENLVNAANTGANKLTLLLKQAFPALIAGGLRQRMFEDFYAVFVDLLGFNSDNDDILQHRTDEGCATLHSSRARKLERLLRKYSSAEQRTEIKHAEYALARIRSRFQPCCWEHLFSGHLELCREICARLEKVEQRDCSSSAAWALRHKSASDFESTRGKSYDVASFFDFLDFAGSDEQRTFRMLVLLEKNFYLGQIRSSSGRYVILQKYHEHNTPGVYVDHDLLVIFTIFER